MIKYDEDNADQLCLEFRTSVDPRLRMTLLELEWFVYNILKIKDGITIVRLVADTNSDPRESRHHIKPCMAADIENKYTDKQVDMMFRHLVELGSVMPSTLKRGKVLHIEVPITISELSKTILEQLEN